MEQAEISTRVQDHFGDKVTVGESCGQHFITIQPGLLRECLAWLRDDPDLDMNMLMDVGGVDYLEYGDDREHRFEVAYQVYSLAKGHRYRVKVAVADDSVAVPSVWDMFGVANWMEREVYDMYGLNFAGHPNLRRILCHDEFEGHALRKDYPINKRQRLSSPTENLLTDDPDWA